jgi:4'-phosphopantetheinyl transferase EntD
VLDLISLEKERAELAELATGWPGIPWARLLFSAKECVYKCWAPLTGTFLDFDGAHVRFDPPTTSFVARLLVPDAEMVAGPEGELHGRFAVRDGLVVTAIARGAVR